VKGALILLPALVLGCSPAKPVVPQVPVVPIEARPSALPALRQAADAHAKADSQNRVTSERVATLGRQLTRAEAEAARHAATAGRLAGENKGNEAELLAFYNELLEQERLVKAMRLQVAEVETSLEEERRMRAEAGARLSETAVRLFNKEAEAEVLRSQLETANGRTAAAETHASDQAKEARKQTEAVSRLKGESAFKTKLLIGAAVLLALSMAGNLLLLRSKLPIPF
jgi:hypothetical protein